jgi:Na+-driven multidrug efflux pump
MPRLTLGRILVFWLPLAATWLMMALEGPFLSAIIARLADPTLNLASYGVAFSIALIIEAPIIMVMSATTALVRDRASMATMKRFVYALSALITLIMAGLTLPPVFTFLAQDLIRLPPDVAHIAHLACIALIPWPGAIGYRRFYQGILIRNNRTRFVAFGTILRLIGMSGMACILALLTDVPGALVGGCSLAAGVLTEAAATRMMAGSVVHELKQSKNIRQNPLTYARIVKFYYPLALTTILALGLRPVATFFLGQSKMAIESLAVFPVIHSLAFLFISLSISYQEVIIALIGDEQENYIPLRNFALFLCLAAGGGLGLIAFTPLSTIWFHHVSGLSLYLSDFSVLPVQIMVLIPALWVVVCVQRGVLVSAEITAPITKATVVQVSTVVLVLVITIYFLDLVGIVGAALALVMGGIAGCAYLTPWFLTLRQKTSSASSHEKI